MEERLIKKKTTHLPEYINEDGTYSDARVLSHLELFRLMVLPDNWNVPNWASDSMVLLVKQFLQEKQEKLLSN